VEGLTPEQREILERLPPAVVELLVEEFRALGPSRSGEIRLVLAVVRGAVRAERSYIEPPRRWARHPRD